jgi:hypothetical protein
MEHTTCPILGPSFGGKPEKLGSDNQYIPSQIRFVSCSNRHMVLNRTVSGVVIKFQHFMVFKCLTTLDLFKSVVIVVF